MLIFFQDDIWKINPLKAPTYRFNFSKEERLLKKKWLEQDKFEEKLFEQKQKEVKRLIFDKYLDEIKNKKDKVQDIRGFFKKKLVS